MVENEVTNLQKDYPHSALPKQPERHQISVNSQPSNQDPYLHGAGFHTSQLNKNYFGQFMPQPLPYNTQVNYGHYPMQAGKHLK